MKIGSVSCGQHEWMGTMTDREEIAAGKLADFFLRNISKTKTNGLITFDNQLSIWLAPVGISRIESVHIGGPL